MKLFLKASAIVLLSSLLGIISVLLFKYSKRPNYEASGKQVHVVKDNNAFTLIKNGEPFTIKGAAGKSNLKTLSEIGGNTFRVYDTLNLKTILDEAHRYNISVIVDIPLTRYNKDYFDYSDKTFQNELKETVRRLVKTYKDHPALLMWNLGNEIEFPLTLFGNAFTRTYNELIDIIHDVDPNHPVSTSLTGRRLNVISLFFNAPKLDLFGFNTFAALHDLDPRFSTLKPIYGKFPYYLSEWGSSGPWENKTTTWNVTLEPTSSKKAEELKRHYQYILKYNETHSVGSLVFYWDTKQEATHTYFSLFDENNLKSHLIETIHSLWNGNKNSKTRFVIDRMQINNTTDADSLIFKPDISTTSNIKLQYFSESSDLKELSYSWEIYKDAWQYDFWDIQQKPQKLESLITNTPNDSIVFKTPAQEGPYRLFVTIYDNEGYFATANLPFYILVKP